MNSGASEPAAEEPVVDDLHLQHESSEAEESGLAKRVSAIYFAYLAGVGLAVTFWPFHLQALGFSGAMIGRIFMVRTGMNIFSQPAITRLADATGKPLGIVRVALFWGAVAPLGMLYFENWWLVAACVWIGGLMTSSLVPLLDATIVTRLPRHPYGNIRMWGSLGYGLIVCSFGFSMRNLDHASAGRWSIYAWTVVMLIGALIGLTLKDPKRKSTASKTIPTTTNTTSSPGGESSSGASATGRYSPAFLALLGLNAFHWFGVISFNIFFGLHTEWRGFSPLVPALGVMFAIAAEALVLRKARRVLDPHSAIRALPFIYLVTGVRWILTATVTSPAVLIAVQLLHGVSFGLWMGAMITVIGRFVSPERRSAAQGLMGGIVFGVGGMAGSATSGYLFDLGGGTLVFYGCVASEVVALLLFALWWHFTGRTHFERPVTT